MPTISTSTHSEDESVPNKRHDVKGTSELAETEASVAKVVRREHEATERDQGVSSDGGWMHRPKNQVLSAGASKRGVAATHELHRPK
jgi:hypothetical protein